MRKKTFNKTILLFPKPIKKHIPASVVEWSKILFVLLAATGRPTTQDSITTTTTTTTTPSTTTSSNTDGSTDKLMPTDTTTNQEASLEETNATVVILEIGGTSELNKSKRTIDHHLGYGGHNDFNGRYQSRQRPDNLRVIQPYMRLPQQERGNAIYSTIKYSLPMSRQEYQILRQQEQIARQNGAPSDPQSQQQQNVQSSSNQKSTQRGDAESAENPEGQQNFFYFKNNPQVNFVPSPSGGQSVPIYSGVPTSASAPNQSPVFPVPQPDINPQDASGQVFATHPSFGASLFSGAQPPHPSLFSATGSPFHGGPFLFPTPGGGPLTGEKLVYINPSGFADSSIPNRKMHQGSKKPLTPSPPQHTSRHQQLKSRKGPASPEPEAQNEAVFGFKYSGQKEKSQ
uniref:Uncharacterized protein n=1 Tax=Timema bartmani TaxID=61472 RepID=A0A7R9HZJ4_9NEOP|nr:unnamed protein product [Timema bartmani]